MSIVSDIIASKIEDGHYFKYNRIKMTWGRDGRLNVMNHIVYKDRGVLDMLAEFSKVGEFMYQYDIQKDSEDYVTVEFTIDQIWEAIDYLRVEVAQSDSSPSEIQAIRDKYHVA